MKKFLFILLLLSFNNLLRSQNIPSYVPTVGLLAWYPFSGNAVDSSGNGWDGTVNGAVLTTDRCGNANSAYFFDGTSNISTLLLPPTGNGSRTISCWFRYDTLPAPCNTNLTIAGYGATTNDCSDVAKDFALQVLYTGMPPTVEVDGVCVTDYPTALTDTVDNGWHFFAAVYDTSFGMDYSDIKLYLDCSFRTTTTAVFGGPTDVNTGSASTLLIGKSTRECERYFWGAIDDIGVWDRALDSTELSMLCNVCPPLETRALQQKKHTDIYPNPATDQLSIRSGEPIRKVEVFNATGQLLVSQEFNNSNASIDISRFDAGVYLIKVNNKDVHKMVKL